ncbi:MAG: hypothetical protein HFJ09_01830 [Lachnospiraceae bacterium]|nr:hypothetical protein [Lachnospiraceae bacterium]
MVYFAYEKYKVVFSQIKGFCAYHGLCLLTLEMKGITIICHNENGS